MPVRVLFHFGTLLTVVATLSTLALIQACSPSAEGNSREAAANGPRPTQPPTQVPEPFRPDPKNLPTLSPDLPAELVLPADTSDPRLLQENADTFSWNTFLALNWPAAPDGTPLTTRNPGQQSDNSTVWESWPDPTPSGDLRSSPRQPRRLTRTTKDLAGLVSDSRRGPLIDQNGRYVRLEIRVNRPAFETLLTQQRDRRSAASPSPAPAFAFPSGSIRIQAAWKILSAAEVAAGRFHTAEALLPLSESSDPSGPAAESVSADDATTSERVIVGLVGFHIARKTPAFPGWVWSTFEHVDNCPTVGEPADRAAYNFFDKANSSRLINQPPARPWTPAVVEPSFRRSQIVRHTHIPVATRAVSAAYQAALRAINPASVWQYYQLVGTQTAAPSGDRAPTPPTLGNTTLEPYLATAPSKSASCIDCHAQAATPAGASADTSFLLRLAP